MDHQPEISAILSITASAMAYAAAGLATPIWHMESDGAPSKGRPEVSSPLTFFALFGQALTPELDFFPTDGGYQFGDGSWAFPPLEPQPEVFPPRPDVESPGQDPFQFPTEPNEDDPRDAGTVPAPEDIPPPFYWWTASHAASL